MPFTSNFPEKLLTAFLFSPLSLIWKTTAPFLLGGRLRDIWRKKGLAFQEVAAAFVFWGEFFGFSFGFFFGYAGVFQAVGCGGG